MRGVGSRFVGLLVSILLGTAGALRGSERGTELAEIEKRFAEANRVWESGDAKSAVAAYQAIAESGWRSPDLFVNMAVAARATGQDALSGLGAYRALLLRPGDAEARELLLLALRAQNQEAQFPELVRSAYRVRWRTWLLWAGTAGFWLSVVAGVVFWAARRVGHPVLLPGICAVVCLLVTLIGWHMHKMPPHPGTAWVTESESVELRTGPFEEAAVAGRARPAELLEIVGADGEWLFLRAKAASEGWVPASSVERVLLWVRRSARN